jgi:diaminohydroxyphosphoribosylaminopyrimidine deaminase/5-amino-6-(5-phosphoribosylamino)uracil reductase
LETENHDIWMRRCLELAERGRGFTRSNPLVGCLVVKDDRIIAEGWHRAYGERHAEADALWQWGDGNLPSDASVYVSLEPCAHHGKTPPCADLLIERGAKKVICALGDPFPEVNGKGFAKLKAAGVAVITDVLAKEAAWQNRSFLHSVKTQRPFIILKWAETLNGFMAPKTPSRQQISGIAAQIILHRWRAEEGAICIGRNTLESDLPQLTNRYWGERQPVRIVLDPHLKANPESLIQADANNPVWQVNTLQHTQTGNLHQIKCSDSAFLQNLMKALHTAGIRSLIVEGGPSTLQSFIQAGLADEFRIIRSRNISWEEGIPAPQANGIVKERILTTEDEILIIQPSIQSDYPTSSLTQTHKTP